MSCKYVLAIDLGASGGRGIVFAYDQAGIRPVHENRFYNGIVTLGDTAYWDMLYLFRHIKDVIREAAHAFPIASIGIDTWGLDFGLLDARGMLMENPVSYRDVRTIGIPERLHSRVSPRELYEATGTQFLRENTIYQLGALLERRPELLALADRLLMMPDLIRYFLTGDCRTEYSIASTTGLMDIRTRDWNWGLVRKLGIPERLLTQIALPGESAHPLTEALRQELGVGAIPVVLTASHDTASAVISVPADEEECLYSSSGTWSILGTELREPIITQESFAANFTNEGGFGGTVRFARSLMGMWLIQECVRCWKDAGISASYSEIERLVLQAPRFASMIDPQQAELQGRGDMPGTIARLCRESGQRPPETVGEFARCIYESMALNYRRCLNLLERASGRHYKKLYIVGGGAQAGFLNQCIADACGLAVEAGMPEATAYGNAFVQLYRAGEFRSVQEYRLLLRGAAAGMTRFVPGERRPWDECAKVFERG